MWILNKCPRVLINLQYGNAIKVATNVLPQYPRMHSTAAWRIFICWKLQLFISLVLWESKKKAFLPVDFLLQRLSRVCKHTTNVPVVCPSLKTKMDDSERMLYFMDHLVLYATANTGGLKSTNRNAIQILELWGALFQKNVKVHFQVKLSLKFL